MKRRDLFALGGAALLSGCGFQLREAPDFAFQSILITAADSSPLASELRRDLTSTGKVTVLPLGSDPNRAQVVFDLPQEAREKSVVSLNASGQVREFELRLRIRFRLRTPRGAELIPETELLQTRDISFNESAVLSKESEEALLYRDMQGDLVQQLMRRLAAVKVV
jgi:LPS-assembly lipoprotein